MTLIALCLLAFTLLGLGYYWGKGKRLSLIVAAIILGVCYGSFRAELALARRLPLAAEGHYRLTGTIVGVPTRGEDYSQAEVLVQQLIALDVKAQRLKLKRIRLGWYHGTALWQSGDSWQCTVKLKPPRRPYNPASFDSEAWLFAHGIDAVGYVSDPLQAKCLQHGHGWQQWLNRLRARLNRAIWHSCQDQSGCAQVQALTVGQRDRFNRQDWQLLQATGTNHLFAIAGLHIGFIASAAFWLGKHGWRHLPKCPLWLAAPTAGWLCALTAACAYSALAGFALPTQRACCTLAALLVARLSHRRLPPWHAWALALLIVLLWQPLWLLDASLWLSFGTVALLIYTYAHRWPKARARWYHFGQLQAVLSLGLWPLTIVFFKAISLSSIIANLFAIPWAALAILPLCWLGVLSHTLLPRLADFCWHVAALQLTWLKEALLALSQIPHSHIGFAFHSPWQVILSVAGVILLLAPAALPARYLGLCYCWAALSWPNPTPKPQTVWLSLLDVGQGLSALIQTQHHALVFDTGNRFSEEADMGMQVVVPALRAAGIQRLSAIVISHGDSDHAGGAASVLTAVPTEHAYTSDIAKLQRLAPNAKWQACLAGLSWQWDGVRFEFLYPLLDTPKSGNDRSCVLKVSTPSQQVLLTGDIERYSEQYLVRYQAQQLASTVLVVPHHGSKTSSTAAFISAVHPTLAVFPVGYHNMFHFPSQLVIQRYQRAGVKLYDTANNGQIKICLPASATPPTVIATRQQKPAFWRFP